MFARAAASRRAALAVRAIQRTSSNPSVAKSRHVSFLPWRGKGATPSQPALPVYFPRASTQPRQSRFWRQIGRVAFTAVIFYGCWQIFAIIVVDPLLDWADQEWDSMSDTEKKEVEGAAEEEPILFLPFPFTTKMVRQPPYKGSDPEWRMFLTVNKDEKLQKEITLSLANLIRRGVEDNPAFVKLMGGKDIKIRKHWLDIIYPRAPPPKHYVAGIIIEDDGIYWGDRPIDPLASNYLNMALYPKAVTMTVYTFFNSLFKQTANDIAKALGMGGSSTPEVTWQSVALNRMKEQGNPGATAAPAGKAPVQTEKSVSVSIPTTEGDVLAGPFGSETQLDPRVQAALQAAGATFSKNWKPGTVPPNRGCIRVDGLVELQGKSAVMSVFVMSWYDPKLRKFMGVRTGLNHLTQLKQRPAGG